MHDGIGNSSSLLEILSSLTNDISLPLQVDGVRIEPINELEPACILKIEQLLSKGNTTLLQTESSDTSTQRLVFTSNF